MEPYFTVQVKLDQRIKGTNRVLTKEIWTYEWNLLQNCVFVKTVQFYQKHNCFRLMHTELAWTKKFYKLKHKLLTLLKFIKNYYLLNVWLIFIF